MTTMLDDTFNALTLCGAVSPPKREMKIVQGDNGFRIVGSKCGFKSFDDVKAAIDDLKPNPALMITSLDLMFNNIDMVCIIAALETIKEIKRKLKYLISIQLSINPIEANALLPHLKQTARSECRTTITSGTRFFAGHTVEEFKKHLLITQNIDLGENWR